MLNKEEKTRYMEILKPMPNKPSVSYGLLPEKPARKAFSAESTERPGPLSDTRTTPFPASISESLGKSMRTTGLDKGVP